MLHVVPSPGPALMIVAKAVAGVPTCTDRLAGSTDAKSWIDDPAFGTKAALTVVSALSATEQSLVPLHPPPRLP
jgi:hypothetical protein